MKGTRGKWEPPLKWERDMLKVTPRGKRKHIRGDAFWLQLCCSELYKKNNYEEIVRAVGLRFKRAMPTCWAESHTSPMFSRNKEPLVPTTYHVGCFWTKVPLRGESGRFGTPEHKLFRVNTPRWPKILKMGTRTQSYSEMVCKLLYIIIENYKPIKITFIPLMCIFRTK